MWTIEMQLYRISNAETFDENFVLRRWADFQFLLTSIMNLRNICKSAIKSHRRKTPLKIALKIFEAELSFVKEIQSIEFHIDEYLNSEEKIKSIMNNQLEVSFYQNKTLHWRGHSTELDKCHSECIALNYVINETGKYN